MMVKPNYKDINVEEELQEEALFDYDLSTHDYERGDELLISNYDVKYENKVSEDNIGKIKLRPYEARVI